MSPGSESRISESRMEARALGRRVERVGCGFSLSDLHWPMGAGTTARPENAPTTRAITLLLSSIPTATISKPLIMVRRTVALPRYASHSDQAVTRRPRLGLMMLARAADNEGYPGRVTPLHSVAGVGGMAIGGRNRCVTRPRVQPDRRSSASAGGVEPINPFLTPPGQRSSVARLVSEPK